ncbi:hypothetical protein [Flavobacterium ginsenosidimutans]|uniref:hypothetical protein n=1 Tax=Flavobacterium ginsenosidimutans TaxID=687844 RepID=UPI000DACD092|nr:hypothetical protein [Flavobacterium ginsenosidimutans]KAF2327821.1 hypothetical protein DM444_18640 [Flavobacterium ginsenosidimutans]
MKMKKIVCMLLLIQSGFLMAQTAQTEETFVTVNGKRVKINPNSVNKADNGLTADSSKVQLGGALLKPTKITTTQNNTLTIDGLQVGASTDNILVADTNGVLKWVVRDSIGDNLGNHIATQPLNIQYWPINDDGKDDWGLAFSKNPETNKKVVAIDGAGLRVDFLDDIEIKTLENANTLKFVALEPGLNEFKVIDLKQVMQKSQEYYIVPEVELSDTSSTELLQYPPIPGQLIYNSKLDREKGIDTGLYYWGGDMDNSDTPTWNPVGKDNLGNHKATQSLDMGSHPINSGGGDWGLEFTKGVNDFDPLTTEDRLTFNRARFGESFVIIDHLPSLKPNDPTLINPNFLDFVTQDISGAPLRSTKLGEIMDVAQNQYFMPKVSLASNDVEHAKANLLLEPQDGQFVYNTNPDMEKGKGEGIYYNKRGYWVPVVSEGADNLGNHTATQNLNIGTFNISGDGGDWGFRVLKGSSVLDHENKDYLSQDRATFENAYVIMEQLPELKPNDTTERVPNGFDFVTQNSSGDILRRTSLNEVMDAAQNKYFMPKISLANDISSDAEADLLISAKDGQFVFNTNPDMENGNGKGVYYMNDGKWVSMTKGHLVKSETFEIGQMPEYGYPLNTETTIAASTQSIDVKYKSRIVLSGVVTIGVKHNTMGSGHIKIKQNGTLIPDLINSFKYSVFNPAVDLKADIDKDASLTTSTHFEVIIDDVEPGTHEFSIDIYPNWSAPITPGEYDPKHYVPNDSYMTYKVYNQ